MTPFTTHVGLVLPVDAANIDTDILVPKQYLKRVERDGLADYLFDRWRYLDRGLASDDPYIDCSTRAPDPAFVLNQPRYRGASVLLARANFGCGSSREQAVWAIAQSGLRALVAPSFGDIFRNNCHANGLLPVVLPEAAIDTLFARAARPEGLQLRIDLATQSVTDAAQTWHFDIDPGAKEALLAGRDAIAATLTRAEAIARFEQARLQLQPWLGQPVRLGPSPPSSTPASTTP